MPDQPEKHISCEVCGCDVVVQRLSARYCKTCKPKALVLNSMVRQLNRLANLAILDLGLMLDYNVQVDDRLMDAFPNLEGLSHYNFLDVINIGLSEYGRISYDGNRFKIVPDPGQRAIGTLGVDFAVEGGDDAATVATFRPRRGAIHISAYHGTEPRVSPTDAGDQSDSEPGVLVRPTPGGRRRGVIQNLVQGFETNPQGSEQFTECQMHLLQILTQDYSTWEDYFTSREIGFENDIDGDATCVFYLADGRPLISLRQDQVAALQASPERALEQWRNRLNPYTVNTDAIDVDNELRAERPIYHGMFSNLEARQRQGAIVHWQITKLASYGSMTELMRRRLGKLSLEDERMRATRTLTDQASILRRNIQNVHQGNNRRI